MMNYKIAGDSPILNNMKIYHVPIVHNDRNYIIELDNESNWPDLAKKTQTDLIEYFKLCIDVGFLKGKLTIKV